MPALLTPRIRRQFPRLCVGVLLGSLTCLPQTTPERKIGPVNIALTPVDATNVPHLAASTSANGMRVKSAKGAPEGGEFFFVRYKFTVATAGQFRVTLSVDAQQRATSDLSYVLDGGARREFVHERLVGRKGGRRVALDPAKLAAGEHTLELRFYPDQRVRFMNRVTEAYERHLLQIRKISLTPEPAASKSKASPRDTALLLQDGAKVVFFGDSITDEELYPGHLARIVRKVWPELNLTFYNSGISLNRTPDALARVERDVLALNPDWVVLCLGVNDAMQLTPAEFGANYEGILKQLVGAGIRVVCVTPSGFLVGPSPGNGKYAHTPDRMAAFDRNAGHNAAAVTDLARQYKCLLADALGALTRSELPRERLMANQWHPNSQGGRMMALEILRALGMTQEDAAKTGSAMDARFFQMLTDLPAPKYPAYKAAAARRGPAPDRMAAVLSYTGNKIVFLAADDGKLIAEVPVGHHPSGAAYSRQRQVLYVTVEGTGEIEVCDVRTFKRKKAIALEDDYYPVCISLTADEDTAWVGGYYGSNLIEVDLRAGKVRRTIPVKGCVQAIRLVADESQILAGTSTGVFLVDVKSGDTLKRAPLEFAGVFLPLADGAVRAIDTVNWQEHTLSIPALEIGAVRQAQFKSRGLAHDPRTGVWWVGDWQRDQVIRHRPQAKPEPVVAVEFPFAITIIDTRAPAASAPKPTQTR